MSKYKPPPFWILVVTGVATFFGLALMAPAATVYCDGKCHGTGHKDTLYGYIFHDEIHALGGRDTAWGELKGDDLYGGGGHDKLVGGDGRDRIWGADGSDIHCVDGNYPHGLEGGPGRDVIHGGPGGDYLDGNAGEDRLKAGKGADTLIGNTDEKHDVLNGGPGQDLCQSFVGDKEVNCEVHFTDNPRCTESF